jgi:hypothetical protein
MKKFSKCLFISSLLLASCLNLQCSKNNPVTPPDNTFTITIDDASCTEVYLRLVLGAGIASRTVTLKRDTATLFTKTLSAVETAITDMNLRPGHSYTYFAQISSGSTAQAQVQTMDTTTHNILWDTPILLGDVNSNVNDITIMSDTVLYAVGAVNQGGSVYNLVKWNGQQWQLLQMQFFTICGQQYTTPYPASSIVAFSEHDIWIAMYGDEVTRFDGTAQTTTACVPVSFSIMKLWGANSTSVYAVGYAGNILLYSGTSWTKIESGTTLPFQDIWGSGGEVLAVASDKFGLGGKFLVQLSGNTIKTLSTVIPTAVSFSGVWFVANHEYYLVGNGIYTKHTLSDSLWQFDPGTNQIQNYLYGVRGNGPNDVVVVGEHGTIAHFNGVDWRIYSYAGQTSGDRLLSVCMRNNLVVVAGTRYIDGIHDQALVCVGRRQ